ncbi:site-specific integrase [uncultured Mameliella sp.]|uniref:tyrosine-type recombinase/integrase n=1 Tax=uncultured Mameliella sp. TaxID=1447087 RepID=UPI002613916C|nr:site-specific integrase [uncultured Mameliella sp.]
MRVRLPGLLRETHRNGSPRWRVRVEGDTSRRIVLPVGPDHADFLDHYYAARAGQVFQPDTPVAVERSLDWLCTRYLDYLRKMVEAGQMSPDTLRQRRSVLTRLCDHAETPGDRYGDYDMDAPPAAFVAIRDAWADRPGAADNLIKTIRAVYQWAIERGEIGHNPAAGIAAINRRPAGGATPWTAEDLRKFKDHHAKGSTPYLWLTLQAFTACRIGDAIWLGRGHERIRDGQIFLEWQPRKRGSAFVSIPMARPLFEATRAVTVVGPAYILGKRGRPFTSAESLRNQVRRWCDDAGLPDKSSHGIRKAVAELMAEAGCTQHQIMAVMSHTQAKTSEVYTRGVQRRILASDGVAALEALDW